MTLYGDKINGFVNMTSASLDGPLDATALQLGGSLHMGSDDKNKASFKEVVLRSAKIMGRMDMRGVGFSGNLAAEALQVGGLMRSAGENKASFKGVSLRGANIKDQIDMSGASFDGPLDAESPQVGGDLLMRGATLTRRVHVQPTWWNCRRNRNGNARPGMKWCGNWARRDPDYSPTPYVRRSPREFSWDG